ncbi:hypothetical protein [Natrinema sp. 1APR25-10V2]|nr:hypothetical protein [Natrinema sp. 1APR25-10V2]
MEEETVLTHCLERERMAEQANEIAAAIDSTILNPHGETDYSR